MENFDEIYKKICEENLKGDNYTVSINTNNLNNNNTKSIIKIHSNKGKIINTFSNIESIKLDSQEFEKYFDVFSNNKILAINFLTSDIMNYMINFKLNNNINFEITIKNSFAYLRIHCNDMFEAQLSKNAFDYNTLYTYFQFLDFICSLNKKIFNTINEKNL